MFKKVILPALLLAAACGQGTTDSAEAQARRHVPANAQTAIFAGGCFWSAETDIEDVPGVISAESGYTGGRVRNPTYQQVSSETTGHLEAVRVTFDPARISYAALVHRFFRTIDPTDPGGQFCDRGESYHTAIFVQNPGQARIAEAEKADANRVLHGRVVTPIRAAAPFYPAEGYHQDYARRNPIAYGLYRRGCGRDARLRAVWGAQAVTHPGF